MATVELFHIGKTIFNMRIYRNKTQSQLAEMCGWDINKVIAIEKGEDTDLKVNDLMKIGAKLNCIIDINFHS